MLNNHQFPMTELEYSFTYAEPAQDVDCEDCLEVKVVAEGEDVTFACRDCGQIKDIDYCLGCDCFVCEECAMRHLAET